MVFKRLVVLADGTWQSETSVEITNILKLTELIAPESEEGVQQVLYYDTGIGTGNAMDSMIGGAMGVGIDAKIIEIYLWLAVNYQKDDEIYMYGFSRGSYTVRSLAGFMYNCGLLRQEKITLVSEAYEIYRSRQSHPGEEAVKAFRAKHSFRPGVGEHVPITLLACFDTVGALGLPDGAFGGKIDNFRYAFHDTRLSNTIKNAIHILSIDEDRGGFKPTEMKASDDVPNQLTQFFFSGHHSGVGGGEATERGLSDYALGWLVQEQKRRKLGLAFHMSQIPEGTMDVAPAPVPASEWWTNFMIKIVSGKYTRSVLSVSQCHPSVAKRYALHPEWRPEALKKFGDDLAKFGKEILEGRRSEHEPLK